MLEKEYRIKSDRLADIEFNYKSKCREAEYSATLDMIYMADPEISEEKKFRQSFKTQQIIDESHEMEKIHSLSIQQYNEYLEIYKTKIENIYNMFEEQENQRQILQKDAMLKLIIFEASYLKNIQYDVERLSDQLQKVNIAHQLQNFIRLHLQDIKVPKTVQFVRYETMISKSLNSIRDKSYYRRQVNLADFIIPNEETDISTLTLKGHEIQQTFSYIYLVLNKMWNNQHNQEDVESVVQILSNDEQARQIWVLVFTHLKQQEKLDIPEVDIFIRHIKQILDIAYENHDVHLGRQILWISSWFRSQHRYLYEFLGDHQLFQSRDFFEAALIENIHDTLQEDKKQSAGLQYTKRIERQKMAIYRAISSICSSMQLLKMCYSEVKILGQKYARLSQLPSELLEQLNVQMEATR